MIEALSSKNLPAPRFRYSPLVKAGPFYKTAGMIALNKETGQLEPGGAGPETARILSNLLEALPDFGLTLDDLVSATILPDGPVPGNSWEAVFSADMRLPARSAVGDRVAHQRPEINKSWEAVFSADMHLPARSAPICTCRPVGRRRNRVAHQRRSGDGVLVL